jgi:hypothetical protein
MRRHGINSAAADESGRPGRADDAGASGLHAPAHDVTLDGKRNNRSIAEENAAAAGRVRSSRDAGTADRKNPLKNLSSAGPRARRPASPRLQPRAPDAAALDNAGSAHAGALGHPASPGTAAPHATAASPGPHPDRACCNSDGADAWQKRDAHTPSADSNATTAYAVVAGNQRLVHTQVGPRESLLPKVKPRSGVGRSASRRFFSRLGTLQLTRCQARVQKFSGALPPRFEHQAIAACAMRHFAAIQKAQSTCAGAAKMAPFQTATNRQRCPSGEPRS